MSAALIITLRETLEAALVVGIILAYLSKTLNVKHKKFVWYGVLGGVVLSGVMAFVFERYLGGFEGRAEELYEGVAMFVAGGLLTWMILWMLNQRSRIKAQIESKAQMHIDNDHPVGLAFLAFAGVAREGIETVIFLQAALIQSDGGSVLAGGLLGVVIAILLSVILFKGIVRVPLRAFFAVTSVLLILFAAGLFAHGLHEFEEAGVVPIIVEHVWDTNAVLDENGSVGGLLKGLFGYNGNPSFLEVVTYGGYLLLIFGAWGWIERRGRSGA